LSDRIVTIRRGRMARRECDRALDLVGVIQRGEALVEAPVPIRRSWVANGLAGRESGRIGNETQRAAVPFERPWV
jgi:hypothetical protein